MIGDGIDESVSFLSSYCRRKARKFLCELKLQKWRQEMIEAWQPEYFFVEDSSKGASGNYDGSRCCEFWSFVKAWFCSDIRSDLGTETQRCQRPKGAQPFGRTAFGTSGVVARLSQPHFVGCSSLTSCHMSQLPFARPIIVSGRAPNRGC